MPLLYWALSAFLASLLGPTGTVVVTNMNDNTATIIDVGSNAVRATLPTGEGPHEVAVSHDGRLAVVANYGIRGKPGRTGRSAAKIGASSQYAWYQRQGRDRPADAAVGADHHTDRVYAG
jgi:YVTN family beta-propeller protein